ncbi:hypothetical protein DFP72DRAFT_1119850 [Ephemerocybe angulata]|uniref:Uncharacterized protein n=1 Tax=Ephemerocybe angulata TaxID=980116 RepID=A0A8H6LU17_9AGAR|nr:hypothetical protein DFP72DRAFT_1119850 [Tulosesus angulatus]
MHQALRIPELIRSLFDQLSLESSLAMALTSHTFLEPGLDRIWRKLCCFEQLVASMPDDLFRKTSEDVGGGFDIHVLFLRRALTAKDIERHKRFYAPKIRNLQFTIPFWGEEFTILSNEAFQALQVVTKGQPGALTPRLEMVHGWLPVDEEIAKLKIDPFLNYGASYLSLFLGDHVHSLDLRAYPRLPLWMTTLRCVLEQSLSLRELTLTSDTTRSLEGLLDLQSWTKLERLSILVSDMTTSTMNQISRLPRLSFLSIRLRSPLSTLADQSTRFQSLEELKICADSIDSVIKSLDGLPRLKMLKRLNLVFFYSAPRDDVEAIIGTIQEQNPSNLESFVWKDNTFGIGPGVAPMDIDLDDTIDISPFFQFKHLRRLTIQIAQTIQLTPLQVTQIPVSWPHIEELILCGPALYYQPPLIDHTHILSVMASCRSLTTIGLRFDSTRITGNETSPTSLSRIRAFHVDCLSPIVSPSRVLKFMSANFSKTMPFLLQNGSSFEEHDTAPQPIGSFQRWEAVLEGWRKLMRDAAQSSQS